VTRFQTRAGSLVITERSRALPLVGIGISVRSGSLFDPEGKEGLTRLMNRAMRMGTEALRSRALEERLDALGAQLSISCAQSYMQVSGVVVAHNLEPFLTLVGALLERPSFRPVDVRKVQREMIADLVAACDDDRTLVGRHFRHYAYGRHPFARPRSGTRESLRRITREDVVQHHARHIAGKNLLVGVWGDFEPGALERLLDRTLGRLPRGKAQHMRVPDPQSQSGLRVLVVDKPERTQTQILIGTLGTSAHDRDHVPIVVGNTAFGGLFTSRLNNEVRVKRGLSYGASSNFTLSRTRDLWAMHTFPAAKDARACIGLQLDLYDKWIARGLSERELAATQRYLQKSHAFEIDTPAKRLDQRLDIELLDWPKTHHSRFLDRVRATTRDDVASALQRRMSRTDLTVTLVATAKELVPQLEKLPRVSRIDVVPFDVI
jgi:zinc protease